MGSAVREGSAVYTTGDPLVITRIDGGFRVYAAVDPSHIYTVMGAPHLMTCSCPDFRAGNGNGNRECAHIRAVRSHGSTPVVPRPNNGHDEPRSSEPDAPDHAAPLNGTPQKVLKR